MTEYSKDLQHLFTRFYKGHEFEYIFFARDGKNIPTNWICSYKNNNLLDLFEAMIFECYSDYVYNNAGADVASYATFFNDFIQTLQKVKAEHNNERKVLSHENYY